MASVKKFTESAVVNQLRHIERTIAHPENMDIEKIELCKIIRYYLNEESVHMSIIDSEKVNYIVIIEQMLRLWQVG